jgi:hypothetical protein
MKLICSGILPSDYKRFANGAGIGIINEEKRTTFFKQHKQHIQQECNDSIETALLISTFKIGFHYMSFFHYFCTLKIIFTLSCMPLGHL